MNRDDLMSAMVIPGRFNEPLTINIMSLDLPADLAASLCSVPPQASATMMVSLTALDMIGSESDPVCDPVLNTMCDMGAGTWNGCYDNEQCTDAGKCECEAGACLNDLFRCEFDAVVYNDSSSYTMAVDPVLSMLLMAIYSLFR